MHEASHVMCLTALKTFLLEFLETLKVPRGVGVGKTLGMR